MVEELKAVFDPRGGADGAPIYSFANSDREAIEKHMIEIGFLLTRVP